MERDGIVINAKSTLGVVAMNVDIPFNIEYPSNAVFFESELNALIE